mgnify:CR=1 FL=1
MPAKKGWYKNKPGYREVGVWGWDDESGAPIGDLSEFN